ncbi:MAG: hypothetical protein HXY37_08920 [Chloroflexi bacterium]|nr:hypothetical protein [Chloroflexota bacterium]
MARMLIASIALLIVIGGAWSTSAGPARAPAPAGAKDVTASVERLGAPFTTGSFARNVWDMQSFNGRIYLAHGNSANSGPDANAGPIPVWYYDPASQKFVNQYTANEDQIAHYRVINGQLVIPGFDPREGWEYGNYYVLERDTWRKMRTIPAAIHTFDMIAHQGRLFAATGTREKKRVVVSDDMGKTWQTALPEVGYTHHLFTFKGELYALWFLYTSDNPSDSQLHRFDGTAFVHAQIAGNKLLPGVPAGNLVHLRQITSFKQKLIYTAIVDAGAGGQQVLLYTASALDAAQRVVLPERDAAPYDLLSRDDTFYVLAALRRPSGAYTNLVYTTTDLRTWRELFRFTAPSFARSFEELNGDFYFGLGTTTAELAPASGDILRVRRAAYAPRGSEPPRPATLTPTRMRENGLRRVDLPLVRADGRRGVAASSGVLSR